jgi:hypothetical protein
MRLRFRSVCEWLCGLLRPLASLPATPECSGSDVVHDHIRPGQHQIGAIAYIVVGIGVWHMEHAGTTQRGETVGGSSRSCELGSGGHSAEMINDGCSDADGKVWSTRPAMSPSVATIGFQSYGDGVHRSFHDHRYAAGGQVFSTAPKSWESLWNSGVSAVVRYFGPSRLLGSHGSGPGAASRWPVSSSRQSKTAARWSAELGSRLPATVASCAKAFC